MARLTPGELASFVEQSCVRQGVPAKLTDHGAIARIAVLLQGKGDQPDAARRVVDRPAEHSGSSRADIEQ